jgi:flagellar assembly factor FliW
MQITQIRDEETATESAGSSAAPDQSFPDGAVLDFASGLPGFPASRQFRLERLAPELEPFCLMRSVSEAEICFVVVAPGTLFPDYSVEIDPQHVTSLGLETADDVTVMTIVTIGDPPTANLLGPLVVNRTTRSAAQVVQYESSYRAAEPLAPRSEA